MSGGRFVDECWMGDGWLVVDGFLLKVEISVQIVKGTCDDTTTTQRFSCFLWRLKNKIYF